MPWMVGFVISLFVSLLLRFTPGRNQASYFHEFHFSFTPVSFSILLDDRDMSFGFLVRQAWVPACKNAPRTGREVLCGSLPS